MRSYILVGHNYPEKKWWNEIVRACAIVDDVFEIHCWSDESAEVKAALQFGHKVTSTWREGTVIRGRITKEFLSFLTEAQKPQDTEIYNKMTPFINIFLDDSFVFCGISKVIESGDNYGSSKIGNNKKKYPRDYKQIKNMPL